MPPPMHSTAQQARKSDTPACTLRSGAQKLAKSVSNTYACSSTRTWTLMGCTTSSVVYYIRSFVVFDTL